MIMAEALVFGSQEPHVDYTERRAAYVVVINGERVALVEGEQKYFLPGGGAWVGETPEETIAREVREELGCSVYLTRKLGEATQYFYAAIDGRHYKMHAMFFIGEFADELRAGGGEHKLCWLSVAEAAQVCFHACHAWAAREAYRSINRVAS
jgi:8-oxo-dGTP diphosphatase